MNPRDRARIQHMLDAARRALSGSRERTRADLEQDEDCADAMVWRLTLIGEAAAWISWSARWPRKPAARPHQVDDVAQRRKLIEVALPLEAINRAAAREKGVRGHPNTLHQWWARRPLAACRAVLSARAPG
jgi:hypothetical protein